MRPAAASMPMSGPPYETTVRSVTGERSSARTRAIGLRREPQPPMPRVMPLCSRDTTSSAVIVLSLTRAPLLPVLGVLALPCVAFLGCLACLGCVGFLAERVADPVGHPADARLVGEPL